jgi:hypothetical protein
VMAAAGPATAQATTSTPPPATAGAMRTTVVEPRGCVGA